MAKRFRRIGKTFSYLVSNGEMRTARCTCIEFDRLLGKPVFHAVSPFGHLLRLTQDEIYQWQD